MVRVIAETGRFSLAAERLGLGQPALTKIVQRVEDEFGVPLFTRGPQGTSLAPFGHLFLEYAEVIERETRDLASAALAMRKGESGHFRIGAGQSWIHNLMPAIIQQVHCARPNLSLSVVTGSVPGLVDELLAGRIDLAFVSMTVPLSDDLCSEELLRDQLSVIARPDHPLTQLGRPCTIEEMLEYGWIIGEKIQTDLAYTWLQDATKKLGCPLPKVVLETHQKHLMVELIRNTDLLAFEPVHSPALTNGDVVLVSGQRIQRPRGTGMIWRKNRVVPGMQFIMDVARSISSDRNPEQFEPRPEGRAQKVTK
ncbi:hypothetical protein BV911_14865 [Pseudoruegeria sp. SK021]|nr:hypothetical protein BV911_14865 [Pseudoruegeria sp. SK021]